MTAATSASDRYAEARRVLTEYDRIPAYGVIPKDAERLATALRALITTPATDETVDQIAERYVSAFMGENVSATVYRERLGDLAKNLTLAGIQAAWESWEPENAPGVRVATLAEYNRLAGIVSEARKIQAPDYPNASTDAEVVGAILDALGVTL